MMTLAQYPTGLGINNEISNKLQFPKQHLPIATTLLNFGYLNRDESTKAFTLSGKLLSLDMPPLQTEPRRSCWIS